MPEVIQTRQVLQMITYWLPGAEIDILRSGSRKMMLSLIEEFILLPQIKHKDGQNTSDSPILFIVHECHIYFLINRSVTN